MLIKQLKKNSPSNYIYPKQYGKDFTSLSLKNASLYSLNIWATEGTPTACSTSLSLQQQDKLIYISQFTHILKLKATLKAMPYNDHHTNLSKKEYPNTSDRIFPTVVLPEPIIPV